MLNMAKSLLNLVEHSIVTYKSKGYAQKSKGLSFFAFLFSSFVYISIFYIFNLSPSSLFNNTKFWFFISNTLILIIALDYGTFSSSKDQKQDLYEEYGMHSQERNASSSVSKYEEIVKKSIPKEEVIENLQEKKEVVFPKSSEVQERKLEIILIKSDPKKPNDHHNLPKELTEEAMKGGDKADHDDQQKKIEAKRIRRSKSDKAKLVANYENTNVSRRYETGKLEPSFKETESSTMVETKKQEPSQEESEFSTMSDEELNRRVEEFIQRFNRQIRLQGA